MIAVASLDAAIAAHRSAYDAFQVAPGGDDSAESMDANCAMLDALDALVVAATAFPILIRPLPARAGVLLAHLRWWLADEAENAKDYQPAYGILQGRTADLAAVLEPPAVDENDPVMVAVVTADTGLLIRDTKGVPGQSEILAAWLALPPAQRDRIGFLVVDMAAQSFIAGHGYADADRAVPGDGEDARAIREAADTACNDRLGEIHRVIEAAIPDLFGPDGQNPEWAVAMGGPAMMLAAGGLLAGLFMGWWSGMITAACCAEVAACTPEAPDASPAQEAD